MTEGLRSSAQDDTRFTVAGGRPSKRTRCLPSPQLRRGAEDGRRSIGGLARRASRPTTRKPSDGRCAPTRRCSTPPTGGPWSFGQPRRYVAGRDRDEPPGSGDAEALDAPSFAATSRGSARPRCRTSRGFSRVYRPRARAALDWLARQASPSGSTARNGRSSTTFPTASSRPRTRPRHHGSSRCGRNTLLAYDDRSRMTPPEFRAPDPPERRRAAVAPGRRAGGRRLAPDRWGRRGDGLPPAGDDAWEGLEAEARGMRAFLADREPLSFHGRFAHWWGKLPDAEVRLLGACDRRDAAVTRWA